MKQMREVRGMLGGKKLRELEDRLLKISEEVIKEKTGEKK